MWHHRWTVATHRDAYFKKYVPEYTDSIVIRIGWAGWKRGGNGRTLKPRSYFVLAEPGEYLALLPSGEPVEIKADCPLELRNWLCVR